jgi:hypothetical protein
MPTGNAALAEQEAALWRATAEVLRPTADGVVMPRVRRLLFAAHTALLTYKDFAHFQPEALLPFRDDEIQVFAVCLQNPSIAEKLCSLNARAPANS